MAWFSSMLPYLMQWLIFPALVSMTKIQIAVKIFSPEKNCQFIDGGKFKCIILCGRRIILVNCP